MKSISISCPCGARIEFNDAAESTINTSGSPDKKGRRFLIEVRADEWQDRHQPCVDAKIAAQTKLTSTLPTTSKKATV
jgi:hypothetical protein